MPNTEELDEKLKGGTVSYEDTLPEVEDTEDGGAIIKLKNDEDERAHLKHFQNIVDEVDSKMLSTAVSDLLEKLDRDKEAREKRDKQYEEGLRRTGLGDDAPGGAQFAGANRVVHPMLVEACVDFSARAVKELFPATGPVRAKIYGTQDRKKIEKAIRKSEFMNWQTTEQMTEFRGEIEQLMTQLPLGGGQYLKIMWNNQYHRPVSEFVAIDDIYLPFAATNFYTADRKTHVQYITKMEYDRRVKAGMYIDTELGYTTEPEYSKSSKANDKIEGREDSCYNEDGLRTIYEIYTYLDFGNGVEPYILSIDDSSQKPLALYRNWEEDDEMKRELDWIVEFPFVPWRGAYPIGLTHMIGGLSGAATGALRALLDSAHIQNTASLLKLKGGPSGQTINIQPTEVCELDGGALIDDIRKLAMPLPFNGPSQVLFSLLGFLVDAGKGIVQTTFEKLSDQNPNQPVGTTMALIEQGMVVFSSIHSRLHGSMARCFNIIHRLNSAYLTEEDIKSQASGIDIDPSDFDGVMDIIPVSDPGIFSETQRFAQVQAIMQRAAVAPQMYDARKVEAMFLRSMKVPEDEVLNPLPASDDMDPVSENVAATMGSPIYVLPHQEHMAHMQVHTEFLNSPLFGKNPAIIKTFLFPMAKHLIGHLLNYYLVEAHSALDKAQKKDLIKDEAEEQVPIILQVQRFIEQQLQGFEQQMAQIDQEAQKYAPQPQLPPDSSMQIAQLNAQVQQQALQLQKAINDSKTQLEQQKLQAEDQFRQQKLQIDTQLNQAKLQIQQQEQSNKMAAEKFKEDQENQRKQAELNSKEMINESDNTTAKLIASAEIESGEKVSLSTGSGINQNPGS